MHFTSTRVPYRQTAALSKTILDYIDGEQSLKPFYSHQPSLQAVKNAIAEKAGFLCDRKLLHQELKKQYSTVAISQRTKDNIDALLLEKTFTVTTAHQNNIFTGPLYFIYKIIHAIKLADELNNALPDNQFVPVYYMGSEDADLEELNHIFNDGQLLQWKTKQTGAVGRMKVDKDLIKLIDELDGNLSVLPNGSEIIAKLRKAYVDGSTLQNATFTFVNDLFAFYGIVILLPDNALLKKQMQKLFENDLLQHTASSIATKTGEALQAAGYKVQAHARDVNLFYLKDGLRERIEKKNNAYSILHHQTAISEKEILQELNEHPERFSPNVILRGLYQETILPNIVFIGGGGETAYWLQLKDLFGHFKISFPLLVLRNSFLIIEKKWLKKIDHLKLQPADFFQEWQDVLSQVVKRDTKINTDIEKFINETDKLYESVKKQATAVDASLEKHVLALKQNSIFRLQELEKKMKRSEKRKFTDQQRQIQAIKDHLFPSNGLQERKNNFLYYYAQWGNDLLTELYKNSLSFEQEFVMLCEV